MNAVVKSLYRYPVKGLSPEILDEATLETDKHFPGDRMYAIENGPSGFDAKAAEHLPKIKYLMLMRQERLTRFKTRYDDVTSELTITQGGKTIASGQLQTAEGRALIEAFYANTFADELRGPPKILASPPGYRFMDSRSGFLSIIDLASVAAVAVAAGRPAIDPLRFRANVYVEGLGAWGEFALVGRKVKLGDATIEIIKPIERCAATDVDPSTGVRDIKMVELLERSFNHNDCGVYARIVEGGVVQSGAKLTPL
jgi:uncharacterized protein